MFRLESKENNEEQNNLSIYAQRRKIFLSKLPEDSIAILIAAPVAKYNDDVNYVYRQNSHFHYLTGFDEPDAFAVFRPKHPEGEFILFNRSIDPDLEIRNGKRAGQEGAKLIYGADESYPIELATMKMAAMMKNRSEIYYPFGCDKRLESYITNVMGTFRKAIQGGFQEPSVLKDVNLILNEMRLYKDATEINNLRTAAAITERAHHRAMLVCAPMLNECNLEAEIKQIFTHSHALSSSSPIVVSSGDKSCILNSERNDKTIVDGDLVIVDAGAEYQYYSADVARTYPANGKFTEDQKAIYNIVLAAQEAGIKAATPGKTWKDVNDAVENTITQGLLEVGILQGSLEDLIKNKAAKPYFMRASSHWLGLDKYDVGPYKRKNEFVAFEPNMVLTVEPSIYLSKSIKGLDERWHNIGVYIKDIVLITPNGNEVLTDTLPKQTQQIEAIMCTQQLMRKLNTQGVGYTGLQEPNYYFINNMPPPQPRVAIKPPPVATSRTLKVIKGLVTLSGLGFFGYKILNGIKENNSTETMSAAPRIEYH